MSELKTVLQKFAEENREFLDNKKSETLVPSTPELENAKFESYCRYSDNLIELIERLKTEINNKSAEN